MKGLTAYSQSSQLTSESEPLAVEAGTGYQPSSEVTFPKSDVYASGCSDQMRSAEVSRVLLWSFESWFKPEVELDVVGKDINIPVLGGAARLGTRKVID